MRCVAATGLLLVVATGCAPPRDPSAAEELAALRVEMREVAELQREADQRLHAVLTVVRDLDQIVARLRDPASVDAGLAAWSEVPATDEDDVRRLREPLIATARAVDETRVILARIHGQMGEEPDAAWAVEYLVAEDAVLIAVRRYAQVADSLAGALQTHWSVYTLAAREAAAEELRERIADAHRVWQERP